MGSWGGKLCGRAILGAALGALLLSALFCHGATAQVADGDRPLDGDAYTAAEAAIFKAWIEAGHGSVSMTGYDNTVNDFRANVFIGTLGATYGGPLLNGPVTTFFPHPITAGLTSVTFAGGYAVTAPGAGSNTLTALGSLPSAGNVAYAIQASKGRAFVWGDEWIEFDSEWSTLPEVKQLWVNVFAWLAPKGCALTPPK